jgi:GNAT superfamily N-acetyltransferase
MIAAPELLAQGHDVTAFDCGYAVLNDWLKIRALPNQSSGASRTYVVTENRRVVGYYALAVGGVVAADAPGKVRRNMPDPIPVMILGRLAIGLSWQGKGLGLDLLRDAILRTQKAAAIAGIRAMLVHAIDTEAARFYERAGFLSSPVRPLTYMMPLPAIELS